MVNDVEVKTGGTVSGEGRRVEGDPHGLLL